MRIKFEALAPYHLKPILITPMRVVWLIQGQANAMEVTGILLAQGHRASYHPVSNCMFEVVVQS